MSLLSRFLERTEFSSYEDFRRGFRLRVPDHFNFTYDVVDVYAREEPGRIALVWCDDRGEELTLTFGELARRTNRAANLFLRHGVGRGDRLMLAVKSRHEFWPCILAAHRIGAVAIPATHMLKEPDLAYRFRKAGVKALVAVESHGLLEQVELAQAATGDVLKCKFVLGGPRKGWIDFDREMAASPEEFEPVPRDRRNESTDPMLIYFTSGTSGLPKMVAHAHSYALAHILTARYWQCVEEGRLHYTVADTGWGKAVWGKLYGQWLAGAQVFVYDYERFDADRMLRQLIAHGVSTFCAPPTVYRFLIKQDLERYDLGCLHHAVVAGEPLSPEVHRRFLEMTGLSLREAYGQTELVATIATWPWLEPRPGSMGRPAPGYQVDLLDPEGAPVEIGEEGEICIRTAEALPPGIFLGYQDDPELTRRAWHDGYYHTGDVAWRDEGGYLWFVGRADDVIKSSGYRIGPFEVESVLMKHPAVLECAVTGVPDPVRGQVVKATIVLVPGRAPSEALRKEIQEFVKENTAPYKYPRVVEFIDEMPKTISGKIRRAAIRHGGTP